MMEGEKEEFEDISDDLEEKDTEKEQGEDISRSARERITKIVADKLLPEVIRRGVEASLEAILRPDKGLKRILPDLKIRHEFAEYIVKQIDDTKNLALRVIASEVRSFLENTNIEDGLRKVLTSLAFEVKTEIKFVSTDDGIPRPQVKSRVRQINPNAGKKASKKKKTSAAAEKKKKKT
ncbi:MAG: hypothetical protein ABIJ56_10490 [Pseudomonadota bacterium]